MSSDASFVQFVVDQVNGAGAITTRFMFGDYALYCNEKVVALICDNKLFVKPTAGGRAYIGTPVEAPAYTGANPSFLIEDKLEDRTWLAELIRITEKEVAAPVRKKDAKKGGDKDAKVPAPAVEPAAKVKAQAKPKPAKKPAKKAAKENNRKNPKKATKKAVKNKARKTAKPKPTSKQKTTRK